MSADKNLEYKLNDSTQNGVYVFVLKGELTVDGQELTDRDGYGLWNRDSISLEAKADTDILIMEVPMS